MPKRAMAHDVVIGSDASCDFPVAFEGVSGRHCRIEFDGNEVRVEDLDSTNGTFVDGEQVPPGTRQQVRTGSEVSLGGEVVLSWDDIQSLRSPRRRRPAQTRSSEPAGFWLRVGATLLDGVLLSVLGTAGGLMLLATVNWQYNAFAGLGGLRPSIEPSGVEIVLFVALAGWIYYAAFEASGYRATPGKMAFGIEVTDLEGHPVGFETATGRHFGKVLSGLILMVGYMMAGFTEKKQALHDIMAGTLITKRSEALSVGRISQWSPPAGYAGFWKRVAAALIDGILLSIISLLAGGFIGIALTAWYEAPLRTDVAVELFFQRLLFTGRILGLVAGWLYFAGFEASAYQATPGKQALGIEVTGLEGEAIGFGKATGRHFGKVVSSMILFVGYLTAGFSEKKQALHDMMAGCLVVNE